MVLCGYLFRNSNTLLTVSEVRVSVLRLGTPLLFVSVCVCVSACEGERERERD